MKCVFSLQKIKEKNILSQHIAQPAGLYATENFGTKNKVFVC
jgi:hypothetical protein